MGLLRLPAWPERRRLVGASRNDAANAGMFRTREAAIKFARDESPNGFFTIIYQPDGLEFDEMIPRAA